MSCRGLGTAGRQGTQHAPGKMGSSQEAGGARLPPGLGVQLLRQERTLTLTPAPGLSEARSQVGRDSRCEAQGHTPDALQP